MLELYLLRYLMTREGSRVHVGGSLSGYNLSHIQRECGVPKATFYRAINRLLDNKLITRTRRGEYAISWNFREACLAIKPFHQTR